jgi:hypothetical protein
MAQCLRPEALSSVRGLEVPVYEGGRYMQGVLRAEDICRAY